MIAFRAVPINHKVLLKKKRHFDTSVVHGLRIVNSCKLYVRVTKSIPIPVDCKDLLASIATPGCKQYPTQYQQFVCDECSQL